ncbi:MAG TPA: peptidyl-prolyl cis-trans isomerase [Candidatus Angelobacter sp.]|nr:peptidyl-prolyl cis-trans isomerase [Candidatus Angelobacter sp.]
MRFLCAILAGAMLTGFGFRAGAELADGIDSIVHDSVITFQDVDDASARVVQQLREEYAGQPDVLRQKLADAYKETLEELQERQLILHDFETAGYNLPESIIDEEFENYIKDKYHGDRVAFIKTLQEEGITYERARQDYRDTFIVEQMRIKNVSSAIIISPHKIETYYLDHKDDFKEEDRVKLRMIVLTNAPETDTTQTKRLAEEILGKLKGGASFADMATIYSQGSQARQGGEWDWVEKSVLRKELADVAFTLKPGQMSGVIETPGAYYIMLVEDRQDARVRPLADVRDQIEKLLLAKERTRLQQAWIEKLRKKTFVREFPY